MEIKKVTLGELENPVKTGIVENNKTVYRLYRVPESIHVKMCFVEDDIAIDIEDFDHVYPILKRDNYLRLDSNQEINEKTMYALEIEDVDQRTKKQYKKKVKEYKKLNH